VLTAYDDKPEGGEGSGGERASSYLNHTNAPRIDAQRKTLKAGSRQRPAPKRGAVVRATTGGEWRAKARTAGRQEKPLKGEPRTWQQANNLQGTSRNKPSRTWKTSRTTVPRAWDARGSTVRAQAAMVDETPRKELTRDGVSRHAPRGLWRSSKARERTAPPPSQDAVQAVLTKAAKTRRQRRRQGGTD